MIAVMMRADPKKLNKIELNLNKKEEEKSVITAHVLGNMGFKSTVKKGKKDG